MCQPHPSIPTSRTTTHPRWMATETTSKARNMDATTRDYERSFESCDRANQPPRGCSQSDDKVDTKPPNVRRFWQIQPSIQNLRFKSVRRCGQVCFLELLRGFRSIITFKHRVPCVAFCGCETTLEDVLPQAISCTSFRTSRSSRNRKFAKLTLELALAYVCSRKLRFVKANLICTNWCFVVSTSKHARIVSFVTLRRIQTKEMGLMDNEITSFARHNI